MRSKLEQAQLDAMHKNTSNWRGIFYYNPKDPRVRVPKLYPLLGWTLNFGNPHAWLALGLIIVFIVIGSFLL